MKISSPRTTGSLLVKPCFKHGWVKGYKFVQISCTNQGPLFSQKGDNGNFLKQNVGTCKIITVYCQKWFLRFSTCSRHCIKHQIQFYYNFQLGLLWLCQFSCLNLCLLYWYLHNNEVKYSPSCLSIKLKWRKKLCTSFIIQCIWYMPQSILYVHSYLSTV